MARSLVLVLLLAACGGKDELCRFGQTERVSTKCHDISDAGAGIAAEAGPPAGTCDGVAGIKCPAGQFCEHAAGQCKMPASTGMCLLKPQVCTQVFAQVCGCDGVTYANDCERQGKGVAKDHDGPCK